MIGGITALLAAGGAVSDIVFGSISSGDLPSIPGSAVGRFGRRDAFRHPEVPSGRLRRTARLRHRIVDLVPHPMLYIFPGDKGLTMYPVGTIKIGFGLYRTLPGIIVFRLLPVVAGVILYAGR